MADEKFSITGREREEWDAAGWAEVILAIVRQRLNERQTAGDTGEAA